MTNPLSFDDLQGILHRHIEPLPDYRHKGPNTRYRIPDAALGACGIFFTQAPSFLEYQRRLQQTTGHNNAHTRLGVAQIPCENPISKLRDPLAPSARDPVFVEVLERLESHHLLAPLRVLDDPLLVALDGTNSFASQAMPCHNGLTRQLPKGQTLSSHAALTPVIVCPGQSQVVALPPEDIMPQDGHANQDCERAAGKRWLSKHAAQVAPRGATFLGDALSSQQPFGAMAFQHRGHGILTCNPDSQPTGYARIACGQATDALAARAAHHWHGRCTAVTLVRYLNDVR